MQKLVTSVDLSMRIMQMISHDNKKSDSRSPLHHSWKTTNISGVEFITARPVGWCLAGRGT